MSTEPNTIFKIRMSITPPLLAPLIRLVTLFLNDSRTFFGAPDGFTSKQLHYFVQRHSRPTYFVLAVLVMSIVGFP